MWHQDRSWNRNYVLQGLQGDCRIQSACHDTLQVPDLFFFSRRAFFCSLSCVTWCSSTFEFIHYIRVWRESTPRMCLYRVLLYNGFIHLLQKDANLIQQPCTVLFDRLAPDKSIFVGLGLNLGAVDIPTSRLMKPLSARTRTSCVKTLFISSFTRLRKRLMVMKLDAHDRQARYNGYHAKEASILRQE